MPATAELTDYYARRACEYDQVYLKPERQADLTLLRARLRELFADRNLYEVACGTGYWTAVCAETATSIFATDYNEEVLEVARGRTLPSTVTFARGDAFAPAAAPSPSDAGFAGFWWSHLRRAEIDGFLRTFFARLSPGARFVFIDNAYVEGSSTPIARTDVGGNTYQIRKLTNGETHEVLKNFPTETEARDQLATHATDVVWERLPYYWRAWGRVR